jgi:hypothetical protein
MPNSPLPLATSLDEVYTPGSLLHQGQRWDQLAQAFEAEYGVKPQKVARAPGRVNVIGELPLLPFQPPKPVHRAPQLSSPELQREGPVQQLTRLLVTAGEHIDYCGL